MPADGDAGAAEIGRQPLFGGHARERRRASASSSVSSNGPAGARRPLRLPQRVAAVDLAQRIQRADLRQPVHLVLAQLRDAPRQVVDRGERPRSLTMASPASARSPFT